MPPNNIDTEIALVEISSKIENVTNAIVVGGLISSLVKKLQTLEDEKKQLADKLVPPAASVNISLKAAFDSFINNWNSIEVQEKSKIVRSILSNITFDKDKVIEINYMQ